MFARPKLHLFFAFDRASKFAFAQLHEQANAARNEEAVWVISPSTPRNLLPSNQENCYGSAVIWEIPDLE